MIAIGVVFLVFGISLMIFGLGTMLGSVFVDDPDRAAVLLLIVGPILLVAGCIFMGSIL